MAKKDAITLKFTVKCNGKLYLPGQIIAVDHPDYDLLRKHSVEFSEVKDYGGEPDGTAVAKAYKQAKPTGAKAKAEVATGEDTDGDGTGEGDDKKDTGSTTKPLSKMNKEELIAAAVAKGLVEGTDFTPETKNKDLIALIEG